MKKILCVFLVVICLLFSSCGKIQAVKYHKYEVISNNAERVEIIYEDIESEKVVIIKELNYEDSLNLLKEFSKIKYTGGLLYIGPPTREYGLNFRVKLKEDLGYVNYSPRFSILTCNYDEYYDLICKYCPDIDLEEYLPDDYKKTV